MKPQFYKSNYYITVTEPLPFMPNTYIDVLHTTVHDPTKPQYILYSDFDLMHIIIYKILMAPTQWVLQINTHYLGGSRTCCRKIPILKKKLFCDQLMKCAKSKPQNMGTAEKRFKSQTLGLYPCQNMVLEIRYIVIFYQYIYIIFKFFCA